MTPIMFLLHVLHAAMGSHPLLLATRDVLLALGEALLEEKLATETYERDNKRKPREGAVWRRVWYLAVRALGAANGSLAQKFVNEEMERRATSGYQVKRLLIEGAKSADTDAVQFAYNEKHRSLRLETDEEAAERVLRALASKLGLLDPRVYAFADGIHLTLGKASENKSERGVERVDAFLSDFEQALNRARHEAEMKAKAEESKRPKAKKAKAKPAPKPDAKAEAKADTTSAAEDDLPESDDPTEECPAEAPKTDIMKMFVKAAGKKNVGTLAEALVIR